MTKNKRAERPIVFSLHGIRTTGKWQKDLQQVLFSSGFDHQPLDFGFFRAVSLLLPWKRAKRVEWFRDQYDQRTQGKEKAPSIVAHSFGTYLVSRALEKYDLISFDRIIFCGSIVRRDFPWSAVIEAGQANAVLNESGGKDFWAGLVGWVVADAGPSGVAGFIDDAGGKVVQFRHKAHKHSDYFFSRNYADRWIPFLQGIRITQRPLLNSARTNFRFSAVVLAVSTLITCLTWLWWSSPESIEPYENSIVVPDLPPDNHKHLENASLVISVPFDANDDFPKSAGLELALAKLPELYARYPELHIEVEGHAKCPNLSMAECEM